jgi:hypothetical protein
MSARAGGAQAGVLERNNGTNHARQCRTEGVALTAGSLSPRDHIATVVAAHGGLTHAVAESSRLLIAHGYGQYAAHLDHHRAELNVAIGELALWLESFGQWANVDVGRDVHPPATGQAPVRPPQGSLEEQLLVARETLKTRRRTVLAELAVARSALRTAGLPADELTAYRRTVRLWAGEAIDVVAGVHRLTMADRCIRCLGQLSADRHDALRREGADVLRQWMHDLEAVDREGELALAESCGYGEYVQWYRAEAG